jgi:hypothetical protein
MCRHLLRKLPRFKSNGPLIRILLPQQSLEHAHRSALLLAA